VFELRAGGEVQEKRNALVTVHHVIGHLVGESQVHLRQREGGEGSWRRKGRGQTSAARVSSWTTFSMSRYHSKSFLVPSSLWIFIRASLSTGWYERQKEGGEGGRT
jgi:hypothetical protein